MKMGCSQSKFNNLEPISLSKRRKHLIKQCVEARHLLAAAHSSYTISLKNMGAALTDYAHGENFQSPDLCQQPLPQNIQPPINEPLPPPPPFPSKFSALARSASMPHISIPQPGAKPVDPIKEEDPPNEDSLDDSTSPLSNTVPPPPEPKSKENMLDFIFGHDEMHGLTLIEVEEAPSHVQDKQEQRDEFKGQDDGTNVGAEFVRVIEENAIVNPSVKPKKQGISCRGNALIHQNVGSIHSAADQISEEVVDANVSLLQIMTGLDDHFLKASESTHEVLKMLEANRMHYHSNFADDAGQVDHATRVMSVITWNRSLRSVFNDDEGMDGDETDDYNTHATVLDKLLAWEKKLYDGVKASEMMKVAYQRKVALWNKQKKHGSDPHALEKTKAAVSHLHTRYIIDKQSMETTLSEIQRLRDRSLYPKFVAFIDGMAKMWETMHAHHVAQLKIVMDIRSIDLSNIPNETSDHHHERTHQLCMVINEWSLQFQNIISHQKTYIQALNGWLKLNSTPTESSAKEHGESSSSSPPCPLIHTLLNKWHEQLAELPIELPTKALSTFGAVVDSILKHQEEELKQKEKCEVMKKEYLRKIRAFEGWHSKYMERKASIVENADQDPTEGGLGRDDRVAERQFLVDDLKKKLEDEEDAHRKLCRQVREKSTVTMKRDLPELFQTMSNFACNCSQTYKRLFSSLQAQAH